MKYASGFYPKLSGQLRVWDSPRTIPLHESLVGSNQQMAVGSFFDPMDEPSWYGRRKGSLLEAIESADCANPKNAAPGEMKAEYITADARTRMVGDSRQAAGLTQGRNRYSLQMIRCSNPGAQA
jgi:hypothetical protein